MHRTMTGIVLLVMLGAARMRAQTPDADTLSSAARDSALDVVLHELDVSRTFKAQGPPRYLSPYRAMSSVIVSRGHNADPTSFARHDDSWLRRAQAAFQFTAICGSWEGHRCPRQNGSLEVTLGAPELQPDGRVAIPVEVVGIAPSETERHARYAQASTILLARGPKGWAVTARGLTRYDDGTLTDPLPLR